jgi:hypothetical protein
MVKDPKHLETQKVMVYLEIFTKMSGDVYELGQKIYMNHQWGGISTKDKDELLKRLNDQLTIIEEKRVPLAKEISKRFTKDTGTNRGPWELSNMLHKIMEDNPVLDKSESEVKFEVEKKKAEEKKKPEPAKAIPISPINENPKS